MAIDRRGFLKATAAQAAILGSGLTGCQKHPGAEPIVRGTNPFRHGVASGDPLADRVILWTRVSPFVDRTGEPIEAHWWIALDPLGLSVVAGGAVEARPETDYTIKVDAEGLDPATDYYYGFLTQTGISPIGRTRTLPLEDAQHVRIAVASCSNYPAGFFNAYACLAERDDLDVVLHLGDYLYEYGNGEYGDGTSLDRIPDPIHEILTLEDYRRRHALYKSDPDSRAAHARHPWITVWDDHESANNSHVTGAENHDPETEGDWQTRKLAAIRAYYEWMPIRELPTGLFRSFRFGELLDLIMLDTRLHGRDPEGPRRDGEVAADASRSLLGEDQTSWLLDALSDSQRAASGWRVIGQQVMVAPLLSGGVDFNPDSWEGDRANRDRVLDHIGRDAIDNVIFLTGDVHSAWVFDVPAPASSGLAYEPETGAGARAVEFVVPAVSSPPLGEAPGLADFYAGIQQTTPHLEYMNLLEQGFVILDLTPERVRAEYIFTDSAKIKSSASRCGALFEAKSGSNHVVRLDPRSCDG